MNKRLLLLAIVATALTAQGQAARAQGATPARDNINALIEAQAKASGLPSSFVHQVVKRESNYNPNAKGGSALGLMQIKHATARGMGYRGDAAGLYDPATNLRYGIAYLAAAYRTAKGDLHQAYTYYNRGFYYAAKRLGLDVQVADLDAAPDLAAAPKSSAAFADAFSRQGQAAPGAAAPAMAYASAGLDAAPTDVVEVPLPPRRPASLSAAAPVAVASLEPALAAAPAAPVAATDPSPSDLVSVPLPPRRPSAILLASIGRPIVAKRPGVAGTIVEASALPPSP